MSLRSRFAAEEENIRTLPTTWVCNTVPRDGTIISSRPILVALVCDPHREVLDYSQIGYRISQESLKRSVTTGQVYLYWSSVESSADAQRYPYAARSLAEYRQRVVAELRLGDERYRMLRLEGIPSSSSEQQVIGSVSDQAKDQLSHEKVNRP
jgi:hypothetical protein